jgi:hypothetical protein
VGAAFSRDKRNGSDEIIVGAITAAVEDDRFRASV